MSSIGEKVGKKRIAIIVVLVLALVVIAGALYFLVIQNPYNVRPIKAGSSIIVVTSADLPSGWTVVMTRAYSYQNSTVGGIGWNWWTATDYNYSSGGKTWHLGITVTSWNSTGLAHDQYLGTVVDGVNTHWTPISLGDEGSSLNGSMASNDSSGRYAYNADYAFRVGNILVGASLDANGDNIYYDSTWITGVLGIQAAKINHNNPS